MYTHAHILYMHVCIYIYKHKYRKKQGEERRKRRRKRRREQIEGKRRSNILSTILCTFLRVTAAKSEDNPHSSNHCVEAHLYTVFGPKVTDKLHAFKNNQNNNLLYEGFF